MSQATDNQGKAASKKVYHAPQLRKLGTAYEMISTKPKSGNNVSDGGSGSNQYAS